MSAIDEITRESWILNTFPEWGTWLNEEIEAEDVKPNTLAMWWLGCTGIWLKTPGDTNLCIDFWCGAGKKTHANPYIAPNHQMARMCGNKSLQPNLRNVPFVLDPFGIKKISAVMSTHYHTDHIDVNVAASVLKNCDESVPFIGPKYCVDLWTKWGVPRERCIEVKPGDVLTVGDCKIHVLESFDRTVLITSPPDEGEMDLNVLTNMDEKAVNYLIETPGGNVYHSGDSHYSNMYAKHGNEYKIDVALGSYGENPRGITDKMTESDILRMAESLRTKVIIPFHHDIWTNFQADPQTIVALWEMKRKRLKYDFKPYIWQVGGKFVYPNNKDDMEYHYPRGFEDCFVQENNVPYPSFL